MPDFVALLLDFVPSFALLIALTFAYGMLLSKCQELNNRLRSVLNGLLFGLIAITALNLPIQAGEGVMVDGRGVIVMLAAPYAGILAGIIAGVTTAAYRLYLGGLGPWAGAGSILTAAAVGIAYHCWFRTKPSGINPLYMAALALVMTATALLWAFGLPKEVDAPELLRLIAIPFAVANPLMAGLVSLMLSHEWRRVELVSELREKEQRLESSQRLAKMGDFVWDIENGEVTWSTPMYELVGYDPAEKIDLEKVNAELHHPEDLPRVEEWLRAGIASGQPVLQRNSYRILHRDGSPIHVQVDGRFEMSDGKPVKLIGSCLDVSDTVRSTAELAAARDEAERANRTKSEFLASMSHELRTPLNAVLGYGQMLQLDQQKTLTQIQLGYVENILAGGQHLLELVNDILDLARIEADRMSLHLEELQAGKTVEACIAELELATKKKAVNLVDNFSDRQFQPVFTDKVRFRQIATNLLTNAIKYNKDGGKVTVKGQETADGYLRLSITDTGIGIPKEKRSGLFQMFHRVSEDSMLAAEGVGIGLAVSKMLAHRLGGRIGFESTVGRGSTFWVDLPLASNKTNLIWTDDLRVGVDAIDKDHQVLFALANKVSHEDLSTEETNLLVDELIDYTRYHFRREEAILQTCGCPDFESHKDHHRKLEARIADIHETWRAGSNPETLHELRSLLGNWWPNHIRKIDKTVTRYTDGKEDAIRAILAEVA
jgi:hemerythrin-like metal-binding protein/PAS domain S-box-containing protein